MLRHLDRSEAKWRAPCILLLLSFYAVILSEAKNPRISLMPPQNCIGRKSTPNHKEY